MSGGSYHHIHDLFRRLLENIQDIIIIGTCGLLFALMVKTLASMYLSLAGPFEFQYVASELIYILVLVEIYRLLIIYIREHRIAVDIMIEVGIVSIMREIILHGILEINPITLIAVSVLFIALLLLLRYGAIRKEEVEVLNRGSILQEFKNLLREDHNDKKYKYDERLT
ncbi:MAG TPA: phosphate-starvation-inducible PsiE family protein [Methanospirillum sp.]|uniref:phosphate-starvation-inducible PsiE family protein n=1 Tax=Methanospirillum sp. TaxID=45200 RepID=UPI002B93133D|nr:phosphate-starvation-inducible PsiE family protein [Methanospirillum sp.]HOJ97732.1 phosphate-starvation-inducible PsiE family protein [Methanospirillum sp.]HPP77181.1 phosphate-starvation-inducible PsiE family protein [Methanospirillum sp.]